MTVTRPALSGLWPPACTAFAADGTLDIGRTLAHSRTLLAEGASGLAILGTTSEANSLTLEERYRVVDAHLDAGIAPEKLLPGTGACAIDDAVALTRHAGELGAAAVLLLPPFYYKNVSDEGLFTFVARLIERSGPNVPPIMLYHIPPMAGVGWSHALIARLIEAFPGIVAGMKDSSGDADHTRRTIEEFSGFAVFPGAEVYLLDALRWGARGCISATANINAAAIVRLIADRDAPDAAEQQRDLNLVRVAAQSRGLIPAIKEVLAARYRDEAWRNVRPPLVPGADDVRGDLLADPAIAALLGRATVPEAVG